jgi:hypothetical protein
MIDWRNRMTGVAFWKAAAALIAMVLIAGATSRARAQSATQDEVLKLQTQFQDAVVAGNVDAIAPMMADNAIFIHGNGVMQGKAEFLAAIKNGQLPLSAYELKESRVILFDGGAIVSGLEDLAFKPRPGSAAELLDGICFSIRTRRSPVRPRHVLAPPHRTDSPAAED